jgi:tRNA modification GTPase
VGEGGIGIIKVSGAAARGIVERLFHPSSPRRTLRPQHLSHGRLVDPVTRELVDEVLVGFMPAPHSYTREDVLEINCHSGYAVLERILRLVVAEGARLAEPGEFTRRAFLSGRIDLTQAEAVIDVIRARSENSLALANRHLRGDLRRRVEAWIDAGLHLQARLEAAIDFPEDLEPAEADGAHTASDIKEKLVDPIDRALADYEEGKILREGLSVVLVGRPNVGKSSLMNALLRKERAIVSAFPGTTRDVVEDQLVLAGIAVRLCDTAGVRSEPDALESLGIERTLQALREADAALWLVDGSEPLTAEDDAIFRALAGRRALLVVNKADLPAAFDVATLGARYGTGTPVIVISALSSEDIARLKTALVEHFVRRPQQPAGGVVPNLRQRNGLQSARNALERACRLLTEGAFPELVSAELDAALAHLAAILGRRTDGALLDHLFSQFCIGK